MYSFVCILYVWWSQFTIHNSQRKIFCAFLFLSFCNLHDDHDLLQFTVLLLVRHFLAVLMGETGDYPFTILTVSTNHHWHYCDMNWLRLLLIWFVLLLQLLVIKASGILLPMYIIMRLIDVVHNSIKRQNQNQVDCWFLKDNSCVSDWDIATCT